MSASKNKSIQSAAPTTGTKEATTSLSKDQVKGEEEERGHWDNTFQFLCVTVGLAVGLGNIWRFPALAYENGGSAFLIPYCSFAALFALPMLYAEFAMGQYSRGGPAICFYNYVPAMQGLGWTTALLSSSVSIYYTVIIAWAGVYLGFIVTGRMGEWTRCGNWWNSPECTSIEMNAECITKNGSMPYYFNNTCVSSINATWTIDAPQEYFISYILRKSGDIDNFGGMNWPLFAALCVMWIIVGLTLIKGVEYMGKAAYVTTTLPYFIVVILFFRGITLDGAGIGLSYYLGQPDFSKLLHFKTWTLALTQLCFSLNVGYGGLVTMASYNNRKNNFYRDAVIVIVCDTLMSLVGGCAVFSTLGYLSKQLDKPLTDVVQSGAALAFIVYPQAMSSMPIPWFWAFLFFVMLLCLGISTEVALVEVMCTCIYDIFPKTRNYKWLVSSLTCFLFFLMGICMVSEAGWYWFNIYNDYTGSTTACANVILEVVIIAWIYGTTNLKEDVKEMVGEPNPGWFYAWFGTQSKVISFSLKTICPLLGSIVLVGTCIKTRMTDKNSDGSTYTYPIWAEVFGWFLNLGPLLSIPIVLFFNFRRFGREGKAPKELFSIQPQLPSYDRVMRKKNDKNQSLPAGTKVPSEGQMPTSPLMEEKKVE